MVIRTSSACKTLFAGVALLAAGDAFSQPLPLSDVTQAAETTLGPGAQDSINCRVPYGDAPEALTPLSPDGWLRYLDSCIVLGGKKYSWQDADGTPRNACLITPPQASAQTPLPLVVWLHPSQVPIDSILYTNILPQVRKADLTGDPNRPGFILLLPTGRNIAHNYFFPDLRGFGWDHWYRNLDRSSPDLNVDAATIDHFIEVAKAQGNVDPNRVYMSGWSNGAGFAILYAINTPGIAAAAVYSAPAPFSDVNDPCWQTPFATQATPVYDLYSSCDISGFCSTGTQFMATLGTVYPQVPQNTIVVNRVTGKTVDACLSTCGPGTRGGNTWGIYNHFTWPSRYTPDMFTYLRDHPLTQ
jgi:pimeloyl-ACP methyl ester carboxylesterase